MNLIDSIRQIADELFRFSRFEDMFILFSLFLFFILIYNITYIVIIIRRKIKQRRGLNQPAVTVVEASAATPIPSQNEAVIIPAETSRKDKIVNLGRRVKSKISLRLAKRILKPNIFTVIIFDLLFVLFFALFILNYFFIRPYVVYQSPSSDEVWFDARKPITIVFDKPVEKDLFRFNISPITPGDVKWIPSFPNLPGSLGLYRSLEFYPEKTILPTELIIVYLVDIQNLTGKNGRHEQSLEFKAPIDPDISTYSVESNSTEVPLDVAIDINFSAPNGEFIEWDFEVLPRTEFSLIQNSPVNWRIEFAQTLEPGTAYLITPKSSLVEKNLKTNLELSRLEEKEKTKLGFVTAGIPFINSILPKGSAVLMDESIRIDFKEEMNQPSIEDRFTITPQVEGEILWEENLFTFNPVNNLELDTEYSIEIQEGATTANGDALGRVIHKFKTVGELEIVEINPSNNITSVDVSKNIEIVFDQPVDLESAKVNIDITPEVPGEFTNDGNAVIFNPEVDLAYLTDYTITVNPGIEPIYGFKTEEITTSVFKTRSETVILEVPWFNQQETFTCNIASTRMVLAYRGINDSEQTIKAGIGIGPTLSNGQGGNPYNQWIDRYGVYWTAVSRYLSQYRQVEVHEGWNLGELLEQVNQGNPSILWWHNGASRWFTQSWTTPQGETITGLNGMHSEIVIGYEGTIDNPKRIITRDPWRGTRYYEKAYFESLWKDSFNNTAVTVY